MFNNNAYLYQYYKYGLEKDKFYNVYAMENVVANYEENFEDRITKINKENTIYKEVHF